jgi:hypothetical protein
VNNRPALSADRLAVLEATGDRDTQDLVAAVVALRAALNKEVAALKLVCEERAAMREALKKHWTWDQYQKSPHGRESLA